MAALPAGVGWCGLGHPPGTITVTQGNGKERRVEQP